MLNLSPAEEREFSQMDRAMREATAWLDDPALMRLAHPVRTAAAPAMAPNITLSTMVEHRNQKLARELLAKQLSTVDFFLELERIGDRRLRHYYMMQTGVAQAAGGFGNGAAGATAHAMRFALSAGRIYTFSDELVQLLHKTKLGTDIPVSELRLPQPNIYIELGTNREASPMSLFNRESGDHAFEGAYISTVVAANGEQRLEVTLTGSPLGHSELFDDAIEWACMNASGQVSVTEALLEATAQSVNHGGEVFPAIDQARALEQTKSFLPKLELIAKCVLFLSLPEAMKSSSTEGTEARKALARAQSGAHRRKAAKVLARSYDRVMVTAHTAVSPEHAPEIGASVKDSHSKSFHWREGHLRNQRHGPGNSLTKIIWIRPTLIRADLLAAQ